MKKVLFYLFIIIGITVAIIMFGEEGIENLRRGWDSLVTNNEIAYLSCEEMPTVDEVKKVMEDYSSEISQINSVPGVVEVTIGDWTGKECPGKGKLLITYEVKDSWQYIKQILDGSTFHDIPYDLVMI